MYNPLDDPIPDDPVQRVHALARDLAYGAVTGLWTPESIWFLTGQQEWVDAVTNSPLNAVMDKWGDALPNLQLLVSFRYLDIENEPSAVRYWLTEKAFSLLERPTPTSIFISYSRQESSAFALLLVARLKAIGVNAFLDMKDLGPGDEWHARLESEIRQREHFICLIGPDTLESKYVRREILWALDAGARTIPVWHNGYRYNEGSEHEAAITGFLQRNAIIVGNETAKDYEGALIELLNYFGVTPS